MNKGFTLAEVLITLGVIGVVAAMTIPVLVSSYQKKQTVASLKVAYSQLNQAIRMAESEKGFMSEWNFASGEAYKSFENYILPYMKNIKALNMETNGSLGITYRKLNGQPETGLGMMRELYQSKIYTLANGTQLFLPVKGGGISIIIDINGFKGPNQFGKDLFCFDIRKDSGLVPWGYVSTSECDVPDADTRSRTFFMSSSSCQSYSCNKNNRGMWCAALIIIDGWHIADDYPW